MKRNAQRENAWKHVDGGAAFIIPLTLLKHANFSRLSPPGNKLIMDLARQYSGFNNGYLCASPSVMLENGWRSKATVAEAIAECQHYGLIQKTRQGGRNRANLYAFTWWPIHEIKGKPLDEAPTLAPSNSWKREMPLFIRPPRSRKFAMARAGVAVAPAGSKCDRGSDRMGPNKH